MSVFKVNSGPRGTRVESRNFYIQFNDHKGLRRRVAAFHTRRDSEQLEQTIEELVARRGVAQEPTPEQMRKIQLMPRKVYRRLVEFGIIEDYLKPAEPPEPEKSLAQHLDEFKAVLIARGADEKWAVTVHSRARRILERAGCSTLAGITEDAVIVAAEALRAELKLSDQTHNHGLAACKAFTRWAARGRMVGNPLAEVKLRKADANRVHPRRALSPDEQRALLQTTETGPPRWGMMGPERALVYQLAMETGLRANEIRTLSRGDIHLDGKTPCVTAKAKHTKNAKLATLPLRPGLVARLRVHLAGMLPGARAFDMPASTHTAEMLRADLAAAGIEYEVDGRFADFHSLRHTFITNLARAGVSPRTAQKLARHSDIKLTMEAYTHNFLGDDLEAVSRLPDLESNRAETA